MSSSAVDFNALIAHVRSKPARVSSITELKKELEEWLGHQPAWLDAVANGALGAAQGAALGLVFGSLGGVMRPSGPMAAKMPPAPPAAVQARSFAAMTGVNSGVGTFVRRVRGKDDAYSSMIAAFASGMAYNFVLPTPAASAPKSPGGRLGSAFSNGVVFAGFQGLFYKFSERFSKKPKAAKVAARPDGYARVHGLLNHLGLGQYEPNFRKGLLEDRTIALWDPRCVGNAGRRGRRQDTGSGRRGRWRDSQRRHFEAQQEPVRGWVLTRSCGHARARRGADAIQRERVRETRR